MYRWQSPKSVSKLLANSPQSHHYWCSLEAVVHALVRTQALMKPFMSTGRLEKSVCLQFLMKQLSVLLQRLKGWPQLIVMLSRCKNFLSSFWKLSAWDLSVSLWKRVPFKVKLCNTTIQYTSTWRKWQNMWMQIYCACVEHVLLGFPRPKWSHNCYAFVETVLTARI